MSGGMKNKWIKKTLLFIGIFGLLALGVILFMPGQNTDAETENALVLLNEIEQLTAGAEEGAVVEGQIRELREYIQSQRIDTQRMEQKKTALFYLGITLLCLLSGVLFLYFKIIRPFSELEGYAARVAKGDFSMPLRYERENFFGAFTWAFDHMRKEIAAAREREAAAIRENKTIIAALSHDIKTPIASISAYAEGLEANLDADYETRERYLQVIMRKCGEVSRLVNDLALHSLSELERLEIKMQKCRMEKLLREILKDLEYLHIILKEPVPDAIVSVDEKRMAQALTNILENTQKYASGRTVEVWADVVENAYEIHVKDNGSGILPEDMPFVMQKFYRGKNAEEQPGSGLGLYIVNEIMNRMQGGIRLRNHEHGLEALLWLPLNLPAASED